MNLLSLVHELLGQHLNQATSQSQSHPVQAKPGSPFANSGAQALQQQQNLHYTQQDPALQGGGALPLYTNQPQQTLYEDYGIGGTDLQQNPAQRTPQQAGMIPQLASRFYEDGSPLGAYPLGNNAPARLPLERFRALQAQPTQQPRPYITKL